MIKAIETKYNGYKFRSRTEAKWAYVFDKLNIKYLYENEGMNQRMVTGTCQISIYQSKTSLLRLKAQPQTKQNWISVLFQPTV